MNFSAVMSRVAVAAERVNRDPDDITVVAVSKGRSVEEIRMLYESGHRHFGENRANEFVEKAARLPDDIHWHFVGPLQTNKVRLVRPTAHLLHSLDRASLAEAWLKGPGRPPPALLQINIGRETQKGGVTPEEAESVCVSFVASGIDLAGVMAIPPHDLDPRPFFAELGEIRRRLADSHPAIVTLSMGMTEDFEVAIEEGATVIRLGRAIFDT